MELEIGMSERNFRQQQAPSLKRAFVCLDSTVVADSKVQHIIPQEELDENQHLQILVGDLVYKTDRCFVKALNKHLDDCESAEGEFYFVSQAAARLHHLQKRGKAKKFQEQLDSFATKFSMSSNVFNQWQAVMDCKDLRDRLAHPARHQGFDSLQDALNNNAAILEPCKDAVLAMISIGKYFKVI